MKYLSLGIGLAAVNFAYQFFGAGDWVAAIDRTFFQTYAVAACWFLERWGER